MDILYGYMNVLLICISSFYPQFEGSCLMMQQVIWENWTRYLSSFVTKILYNILQLIISFEE